jgi:hypothetical protein
MSTLLRPSSRRCVWALVAIAALGLAACSGSTAATNPPASVAVVSGGSAAPSAAAVAPSDTTSAPSDSAGASTSPASGPTAVPTSLDPCQLISSQEAGQLAATNFGTGKEEKLNGNAKMCIYGYQTKNVFEIIVAVSPDVATAKKEEAAMEAEQSANAAKLNQGLTITKMPGFTSDSDAVLLEIKPNALGIAGRAIYVLRGTVFFGFNDLVVGGSAPSAEAMKAEAMTVLGRLP